MARFAHHSVRCAKLSVETNSALYCSPRSNMETTPYPKAPTESPSSRQSEPAVPVCPQADNTRDFRLATLLASETNEALLNGKTPRGATVDAAIDASRVRAK
jgi:hypothetical protein